MLDFILNILTGGIWMRIVGVIVIGGMIGYLIANCL